MIEEKYKPLLRRIIEVSYRNKLAHIGSCILAAPIIDDIFSIKRFNEKFILSSGHAAVALYVVLEKYNDPNIGKTAEEMWRHHGTHPDRCKECGIDFSSGSLGHGIGAATGMALTDKGKNVYVLLSDGEMQEGSVYEALEVAHQKKLSNLKVYVNCNGHGAYQDIDYAHLVERIKSFTNVDIKMIKTSFQDYPEYLHGQLAHYKILNKEEYNECMEVLK